MTIPSAKRGAIGRFTAGGTEAREMFFRSRSLLRFIGLFGVCSNQRAVFVTESFLDAIALHEAMGDDILCVGAVSSGVRPESEIMMAHSKHCPIFLFFDRDDTGEKMRDNWANTPSIKVSGTQVPEKYGKDIGEAVAKGLPLKD